MRLYRSKDNKVIIDGQRDILFFYDSIDRKLPITVDDDALDLIAEINNFEMYFLSNLKFYDKSRIML